MSFEDERRKRLNNKKNDDEDLLSSSKGYKNAYESATSNMIDIANSYKDRVQKEQFLLDNSYIQNPMGRNVGRASSSPSSNVTPALQSKVDSTKGITLTGPYTEGIKKQVNYSEIPQLSNFQSVKSNASANPANRNYEGFSGTVESYMHAPYSNHNFNYMTDEEVGIYDYLWNAKGAKAADDYATSLDNELNTRAGLKVASNISGYGKGAELASNTFLSAALGAQQGAQGILDLPNAIMGTEKKEAVNPAEIYASQIRSGGGVDNVLYDVAQSAGQMGFAAALGGPAGAKASATAFGAGIGGNAYQDSINQGYDVNNARMYALTSGTSEAATQYLLGGVGALGSGTFSNLAKNSGVAKAAGQALSNVVKNPTLRNAMISGATSMGSEGLQEYVQTIADKASRNIIFGENNEISLADPEAWYSAMVGAITAGVMNAPGAIVNRTTAPQMQEQEQPQAQPQAQPQGQAQAQVQAQPQVQPQTQVEPQSQPQSQQMVEMQAQEQNQQIQEQSKLIKETEQKKIEQQNIEQQNTGRESENKINSEGYLENGQKAIEENYTGNIPMKTYLPAFKEAYDAGRNDLDPPNTLRVNMLDENVAYNAYVAGMKDRNIQLKNAEELSKVVGEKTGLNFVIKTDPIMENGQELEGYYKTNQGEIAISLNADNILSTTSHELTHFIKEYDNEGYNDYKKIVVDYMMSSPDVDYESLVKNYQSKYKGLNEEQILDEVAADATERFFNDETFIDNIASENPSVAKKIIEFFTDLVDSIKKLITKTDAKTDPGKALERNLEVAEQARNAWSKSLEEASAQYKYEKNYNKKTDTKEEKKQETDLKAQVKNIDSTIEYETVVIENEKLKKANELLKKQFELTDRKETRIQDIRKIAKELLNEYTSDYSLKNLEKQIKSLYDYIRTAEQVDGQEIVEVSNAIAAEILENSVERDTTMSDYYKDLRTQIQNTKIAISEQDKADLARVGGYNEFRKKNFGKLKLGKEGISVDTFYQELSSVYPEMFGEDITHPADQLIAIQDAMEATQEQVTNPYKADIQELTYIVGNQILESYYDVRSEAPTFADKQESKLNRIRSEYSERMADFKSELKEKYKEREKQAKIATEQRIKEIKEKEKTATEEQKKKYQEQIKELRETKNQKLFQQQEKFKEKESAQRNKRKAREDKKIIVKEIKTMQNWLLKPNDSKHIPESLRKHIANFLNSIDFSSDSPETNRSKEWAQAKEAFRRIIDSEGALVGDDGEVQYIDVDPDIVNRIAELENEVKDIDKLDNLDAYRMEELKKVVVGMKKAIIEQNQLKGNEKYRDVSLAADAIFSELKERKTKTEYSGVRGWADNLTRLEMVDPLTFFEGMGKTMSTLYDTLRQGLNSKTQKVKQAQDYINEIIEREGITKKEILEWSGPNAKPVHFKLTGGSIDLTQGEIMSLYELNKRNQAKGHIYHESGGIKQAPRVGKGGKYDKSIKPLRVSKEDVETIISSLSNKQKSLADAIQEFMGKEIADWGNESSMEMYGYKKFTAKNYFPIKTDQNYIATTSDKIMNDITTIKNMGITKSVTKYANNPVIVEDILDVFSRQVDQMSTYNAYVVPLSDVQKVYNYKDMRTDQGTIKQAIERVAGRGGNKYIHQLLVDINGSAQTQKGLSDNMISRMKAAMIAGNISVMVQQPASYARAFAELDLKYAAQPKLGNWETILKYAPIAQWKDWGFYQMQVERSIKDILVGTDKPLEIINNKLTAPIQAMDVITWRKIWGDVENEIKQTKSITPGTEEFYQAVGKRFSEIIDKTQVVDSVLHRSQIMRSKNSLNKMITAFMGEPTKTVNMMYRANPKDIKHAAKTASSVTVSIAIASAMAGFMSAVRDDDREKDFEDKVKEHVIDRLIDGYNPFNYIPYIRDIVSVAKGYDPIRTDMSAWTDIKYALDRWIKVYEGKSPYTMANNIIYTARMTSKLFGVPLNTVLRDASVAYDKVALYQGSLMDYEWHKSRYDISQSDNLKMYTDMMVKYPDIQEQIREELLAARQDLEKLESKLETEQREQIETDQRVIDAAKARVDGDPSKYKKLMEEVVKEYDFPKEVVQKEIDKQSDMSSIEGIDYSWKDAFNALNSGNKTGFDVVTKEIYNQKIKDGKTEKEALSEIRSQVTKELKPLWQEGSQTEKNKILNQAKVIKVNGKYIYDDYDFSQHWKEK